MTPVYRLTYTVPRAFDGMKAREAHATPIHRIWGTCEELLSRATDEGRLLQVCQNYYRKLLPDDPLQREGCTWRVFTVGCGRFGQRIGILETRMRKVRRKTRAETTLFLVTGGYLLAAESAPNNWNEALNYARHFNWQAAEAS